MPELTEDMYCSQQICIPPSFPYLLRQYAKAAIRTQPIDLLRWSTAYFRCLSLNLPPPVKPRLEYPIPKSHFGLTPGWLRALMYQLQNNLTVPFKVLWDRWIGACLQHVNLIEILCLGNFNDPQAVPWFRFVALCAGHLTENLTQTMIMICEIITEEPEGGSAMIPVEVFNDVYQFLAAIEAAEPQMIRNTRFTDSLLSLFREPPVIEAKESTIVIEEEEEEEMPEIEEEHVEEVIEKSVEDLTGVVISCPDIAADDYKTEEDFLADDLKQDESETRLDESEEPADEEKQKETPSTVTETAENEKRAIVKRSSGGSIDTLLDYRPEKDGVHSDMEAYLAQIEDGQAEEEEMHEEKSDSDILKLKAVLEAASGPTDVSMAPSELFPSDESEEKMEEVEEEEIEEKKGECVYIAAIPGIGPTVPRCLVDQVVKYMKECSYIQHGMVMPRNIRHFTCPPLEVMS